jgi:hypothetical protein
MPKIPPFPKPADRSPIPPPVSAIVPKPPTAEDVRNMTDPVGWIVRRYPDAAERIVNRGRKGR